MKYLSFILCSIVISVLISVVIIDKEIKKQMRDLRHSFNEYNSDNQNKSSGFKVLLSYKVKEFPLVATMKDTKYKLPVVFNFERNESLNCQAFFETINGEKEYVSVYWLKGYYPELKERIVCSEWR